MALSELKRRSNRIANGKPEKRPDGPVSSLIVLGHPFTEPSKSRLSHGAIGSERLGPAVGVMAKLPLPPALRCASGCSRAPQRARKYLPRHSSALGERS